MNDAKKMLNRGLRTTKINTLNYIVYFPIKIIYILTKQILKIFLKNSHSFFKNEKDNKQLSISYIDLATCYQKENQFETACLYYQKASLV